MTFEEFQATRKWSNDLAHEPNLDLGFDEIVSGFLYEGGLHIFAHGGGASPQDYELVIANTVTRSEHLEDLERTLFQWAVDEGLLA